MGRYKINKRLNLKTKNDRKHRVFQVEDFVLTVRELIKVAMHQIPQDDIDSLGNRRIRAVGELVQSKFRAGLLRPERLATARMTGIDIETVGPSLILNSSPITTALREFFASALLSPCRTCPLCGVGSTRPGRTATPPVLPIP